MHLKTVEKTEWDAAGELGYVIQAAQNMRILYFNALGILKSGPFLQSLALTLIKHTWAC